MALNWLKSLPYGKLETRTRIFPDAEAIGSSTGLDEAKPMTFPIRSSH
jgi:hypothetical protein